MKPFSSRIILHIIGVLCLALGVIATDQSSNEAKRKESLEKRLKILCDNHHYREPHFDDEDYNKMFDGLKLMNQSRPAANISETTFEERLEYIHNVYIRENEVEPRCLHNCIKNETYTDCLRTNILITMLFHSLHCDSPHKHFGTQQINLMESDRPEAEKIVEKRSIEEDQRFLKIIKFNFNQTRNPHSFALADTSNIIFPDKSFKHDFKTSNSNAMNESEPLNYENVPQLTEESSQVDTGIIFKNERGVRVQRETNDKTPQPLSSNMNGSSSVASTGFILDHLEGNSIPSEISPVDIEDPTSITLITAANLKENAVPSEQIISSISPSVNIEENPRHEHPSSVSSELKIFEKKERDVSALENEHMNLSSSQAPDESKSFNSILLKNETEISHNGTEDQKEEKLKDLATIAENVTTNPSTLLFEEIKVEGKESNLTDLVFEKVAFVTIIPSHENEKSEVVIKEPNDGNKTGSKLENSIILNKEVKADNKNLKVKNGSASCSGSCSDQEESFKSTMDVPKTSNRLVFGITAFLIVLGLAAGAIAIFFFVFDKKSPCPPRQRSNVNINQPPQSRG
ncbi:hypothetical protein LSTR_LSTR013353 [Laodelphax striatellus]|uniref:Uncharacterized protein n=1 Tax=Laodelphax striatellus TaxID=195883 RepID=A0A482XAC1_LAOST|nr:hypothetical protein LSTR_LSTR013353 [Laodelphax striatellus]